MAYCFFSLTWVWGQGWIKGLPWCAEGEKRDKDHQKDLLLVPGGVGTLLSSTSWVVDPLDSTFWACYRWWWSRAWSSACGPQEPGNQGQIHRGPTAHRCSRHSPQRWRKAFLSGSRWSQASRSQGQVDPEPQPSWCWLPYQKEARWDPQLPLCCILGLRWKLTTKKVVPGCGVGLKLILKELLEVLKFEIWGFDDNSPVFCSFYDFLLVFWGLKKSKKRWVKGSQITTRKKHKKTRILTLKKMNLQSSLLSVEPIELLEQGWSSESKLFSKPESKLRKLLTTSSSSICPLLWITLPGSNWG